MREGRKMDIDGYYARQLFNSVHIGDFKLIKEPYVPKNEKVAVIMPVYNCS